jgi:hypothetical protein
MCVSLARDGWLNRKAGGYEKRDEWFAKKRDGWLSRETGD